MATQYGDRQDTREDQETVFGRSRQIDIGLPFVVTSEDGNEYVLDAFNATMDNVKRLWEQFTKHRVLFCDQTQGDFQSFLHTVFRRETVILSVNDVGIVYVTNLIPGYSATAHFFFWDLVTAGRHKVIFNALLWGMDHFGLHRVDIEVPEHAYSALHRLYRMGVRFEGLRREAQLFKGKWHDMLQFGILRSELNDQVLSTGALERVHTERGWFGYLGKKTQLMEYINRRTG